MTEVSNPVPKIIAEKNEDFKQIFADGAYTWLGTDSGTITFFTDNFVPEIDGTGNLQIKSIKRHFLVEIRMSPMMYDNLINWMIERKKILEEAQKISK
jgi:hypothetical protein